MVRSPPDPVGARTRRIALVGSLALLLVAAGCTNELGSAAVVDGHTIDQSALAIRINALTADLSAASTTAITADQQIQLGREQLTAEIRHQLLTALAAQSGISVSTAQINAVIGQAGRPALAKTLLVPDSAVDSTVADLLTIEGLLGKVPAAGAPVTDVKITIAGVQVASRAAAVATRSRFLTAPDTVAATIAAAPTDSQIPENPASLLADANLAVYGLYDQPDGSVIVFPSALGYGVVRITNRSVSRSAITPAIVTSLQSAVGQDASALQNILDVGSLLLAGRPATAGVVVNPRYGQWDPLSVQVVPVDDGL